MMVLLIFNKFKSERVLRLKALYIPATIFLPLFMIPHPKSKILSHQRNSFILFIEFFTKWQTSPNEMVFERHKINGWIFYHFSYLYTSDVRRMNFYLLSVSNVLWITLYISQHHTTYCIDLPTKPHVIMVEKHVIACIDFLPGYILYLWGSCAINWCICHVYTTAAGYFRPQYWTL